MLEKGFRQVITMEEGSRGQEDGCYLGLDFSTQQVRVCESASAQSGHCHSLCEWVGVVTETLTESTEQCRIYSDQSHRHQ